MIGGRTYIDGNDAYNQYGVYVVEGGYNELVSMPPLKPVKYNDWHEEDGIEVDLTDPKLDSREVTINFALSGVYSKYISFIDLLSDGSYHVFNFNSILRSYKLRLVSNPNNDNDKNLSFFTLKFADDFPLAGYSYLVPSSSIFYNNNYQIDGTPLSNYGVRVLRAISEIKKTPDIKTNLLRNVSTMSGAIYDTRDVYYNSKDVQIECNMIANSLTELWRNYDALLYDLIRPDERMLYVRDLNHIFPFYYINCKVTDFYPTDKIWMDFSITLKFTRDFRIDVNDQNLNDRFTYIFPFKLA